MPPGPSPRGADSLVDGGRQRVMADRGRHQPRCDPATTEADKAVAGGCVDESNRTLVVTIREQGHMDGSD